MDSWLAIWLTPISTVVLVGVTAWYAWLTRSLARSAQESAASAERAADLAARSVAASVAAVDVAFAISPNYTIDSPDRAQLGVSVFGDGATVFVHRATLNVASIAVPSRAVGGKSYSAVFHGSAAPLVPDEGEASLPVRLHKSEALQFVTEPPIYTPDNASGIAHLDASIWYSLDGSEPAVERRVLWWGTPGVDYDDPDEDEPSPAALAET